MSEIIEMKLGRDGTYQESFRTPIPPRKKVKAETDPFPAISPNIPQVDLLNEIHKAAEGYLINFVRSFL